MTNIALIGAGNLGWHLGKSLHVAGARISQIFSRNLGKTSELATALNAVTTDDLRKISPDADLYLIAVHDSAIEEVADRLPVEIRRKKLIAHTSGATPMQVFSEKNIRRYGVFYPLQTFSRQRETDMRQVPFCLDANNEADFLLLKNLALTLSPKVHRLDDRQRAQLHVAAVFANNFSNHLFAIAQELLQKENMPFDLLLPLIRETVAKLEDGDPDEMQTGPARRKDTATIARHLQLLENQAEVRAIYEILTKHLINGKW